MIKTILFDLDATLLLIEQEHLSYGIIKGMSTKAMSYGFDPKKFSDVFIQGVTVIAKNDGQKSNNDVFFSTIGEFYSKKELEEIQKIIYEYYETDFDLIKLSPSFKYDSYCNELLESLKEKNYNLILATAPVFPKIATYKRMSWAGIDKSLFDEITTIEESRYCKPNPHYYLDILERHNLKPEECVMIGNDTIDDLSAEKVGIKTFIVTDYLYNRNSFDINNCNHGTLKDVISFIDSLETL